MTSITQLIQTISPHIPFSSVASAQAFLNQLSVDDQAALISALYIGRDHIHSNEVRPDYVPHGVPFDRYFVTGPQTKWEIPQSNFAQILHEKNTALQMYYNSFLRCASNYGNSLTTF